MRTMVTYERTRDIPLEHYARTRPSEPYPIRRRSAHLVLSIENMELLATVVLLLLLALVVLPAWPYSRRWGFFPTGTCGGVVLVIVAMILLGRF